MFVYCWFQHRRGLFLCSLNTVCYIFICIHFIFVCFVLVVHCIATFSADTTAILSRISALIYSLFPLFKASQGDIGAAVGLLTAQSAEVQDPGEPQEAGTSAEAWEGQKGTLGTEQACTK